MRRLLKQLLIFSKNQMNDLICIRLIEIKEPSLELRSATRLLSEGKASPYVYSVDTSLFRKIPNAPFSYWVEHGQRSAFAAMPRLESDSRTARLGLSTGDDFRFVRCWWETPIEPNHVRKWWPFAKGGSYSPYYSDLYLELNWGKAGEEINAMSGSAIRNPDYVFNPGLTWSEATTKDFGCRILPKRSIFSNPGPAVFFKKPEEMLGVMMVLNGTHIRSLISLSMGLADTGRRHYTVGTIQNLPIPELAEPDLSELCALSRKAWLELRRRDFTSELSHFFVSPLPVEGLHGLMDIYTEMDSFEKKRTASLREIESSVARVLSRYYNFQVSENVECQVVSGDDTADGKPRIVSLGQGFISFAVGHAFSRWKIVKDVNTVVANYGDDPLAELPSTSAARSDHLETSAVCGWIVSDEMRERVYRGLCDLVGRDKSEKLMADILAELEVDSLDEYLSKPLGFFAQHLSTYSESRRQAPIYWPISTKSGIFTLWVYYPKLDDQSLPKLIADVLSPKIRTLTQEIENRRASPGGKVAELEALRQELEEMRADFLALINRGYSPNQNDGVLTTACPLAKYFRHTGFRKSLDDCWKELSRGDYDWAHLAMSMWPERALEACKKDRSIAIAHGREDLCPAEPPKAIRRRKKATPSA